MKVDVSVLHEFTYPARGVPVIRCATCYRAIMQKDGPQEYHGFRHRWAEPGAGPQQAPAGARESVSVL